MVAGWIDGWMDGRDVQIPPVFYKTLSPPVPSGAVAQKVKQRKEQREKQKEKHRKKQREKQLVAQRQEMVISTLALLWFFMMVAVM